MIYAIARIDKSSRARLSWIQSFAASFGIVPKPIYGHITLCPVEEGDLESVKDAVKEIAGTHDFSNFSGRPAPDSRRTVFRAEFYDFSPMICFYFSGNGFLHKMVRRLVGGLHEVYTGKISKEDFITALHEKNCHTVQEVAPPKGLYLKKVFYKPGEWKEDLLLHPPFFY